MSAHQNKIPESKSKSKFQSLNINTIYQGAASKQPSKNLPPKHGLQSLGKVPTARRAPVNLPSEKSEKGGNDPSVVLVPSGGGWANKEGDKESVERTPGPAGQGGQGGPGGAAGGQAVPAGGGDQAAAKSQAGSDVASGGGAGRQGTPPSASGASAGGGGGGPKLWSSVTGSGPGPAQQTRQKNFLHQKSPLFGQEFPSLPGDGPVPAGSQAARDAMMDSPDLGRGFTEGVTGPHSQDPAYGPGPNLRPQTFGTWSQGGAGRPGGPQTEGDHGEAGGGHLPPQPHKPQPPPASAKSPGTTQYKSIMPPFMEGLELPAGPPQQFNRRSGGHRGREGPGPRHNNRDNRSRHHHQAQPTSDFTAHSIIDTEKLKRMDDLDNGNDWTYEDDDFDYNKKLESDEEDSSEPAVHSSNMSDPNWADQVQPSQQGKSPHQHYNFYDEFKSKPGVGFDEEERRRNKKSEEVMKNIERARQRREEEENRYRRQPGPEGEAGGPHYNRDNNYSTGRYRGDGRLARQTYEPERFDRQQQQQQQERYYENYREGEAGQYKRKEDYRGRYEEEAGGHHRREERYQRHDSEVSATESLELQDRRHHQALMGSASPEWSGDSRNQRRIQDWVQDVEEGDQGGQEREEVRGDHDRPSRPNSRDSRVSKDSRGSKGSRASRDRELGFGSKKDEKLGKFYSAGDNDKKPKPSKQSPLQDIRGYFRDDVVEQDKKQFRHAPGPITKEKLESFEMKESMTQLKKRETKAEDKKEEKQLEKVEPTNVLSSLLDSDLLENISEDDDILDNDEEEKEVAVAGTRGGRGRGRGRGEKFVGHGRGGGKGERQERGERGGRAGRGGRDSKRGGGGGGGQNKWNEGDETGETEEDKKARKPESLLSAQQQSSSGFLPRGQPSRRGRGEGRVKQGSVLGRGKMTEFPTTEEIGDWSEQAEKLPAGGRGKPPPRLGGRGKKEGGRPGSGGGDEVEEWETASETSLEEREKRRGKLELRGGGRGGSGRGRGQLQPGRKGGPGNAASGSLPGAGGPASLGPAETEGPEAPTAAAKRPPGIENFDLTDYAGVHVVDDSHWADAADADTEQVGEGEGFMQVVNKKGRGGVSGLPLGQRDSLRERRGQDPRDPRLVQDKKVSKNAYDRRQSKLPPRLAKQREVAKAQARSGPGQQSPSPGTENGWPEGDKMGVFNIDTGTGAWEKPGLDTNNLAHAGPAAENGSIQQTIIFENTAYKGGKSEKMDKAGPIQLPLSFSKQDADNGDLKLDFTFGGEENCLKPGSGQPPLSTIPKSLSSVGLPASPSTDDLQTKLANTKKLWDAPGMPVVPENSNAGSWNESDLYGENPDSSADKTSDRETVSGSSPHSGVSNIAKVKPQQQLNMESERGGGNTALQYNRMAVPSPPGNHSLPPLQTPLQPWAFLGGPGDSRSSPMYNPYSPLNQSILMPGVTGHGHGHNLNTDIFNSNNGGYRGVQGVPTFPGSGVGHTTTNNVLMSQASLINSQGKLGTGIGPIGTKAGAGGPGPSSPYLTNLPNTNSNIFIQYDNSGAPLNYMPGSAPPGRGNPPSQTAFYQSLAAGMNRQQQQQHAAAFNALQAQAATALSHQQLRATAVAGMPFQKMEQAKSPVSLNDSGFTAVPPYNGRATNPAGGPPSPKTKLKIAAQHQEQAKINAGMNSLNINNLNALAQMQRTMNLGHFNNVSGLLQQPSVAGQYNPSPIARPQVSHSQAGVMSGAAVSSGSGQLSKQMNQYFNQDGGEAAKYEGAEETLAAEKAEKEEAPEELCDPSPAEPAQPAEPEAAGVSAN